MIRLLQMKWAARTVRINQTKLTKQFVVRSIEHQLVIGARVLSEVVFAVSAYAM